MSADEATYHRRRFRAVVKVRTASWLSGDNVGRRSSSYQIRPIAFNPSDDRSPPRRSEFATIDASLARCRKWKAIQTN